MSDYIPIQFNLNRFFKEIHLKKQYLRKIQNNVHLLNKLKEVNHKKIGSQFSSKLIHLQITPFVMYIIEISFSKKKYIISYYGLFRKH